MTDPRNDPRLSDPAMHRPDGAGGMWGWIAGTAVLVLIAIILIAGWNHNTHLASNPPAGPSGTVTAPAPKSPLAATPHSATTGAGPATQPVAPPAPTPSKQ